VGGRPVQGLRQGEALGLRWSYLDIDVPEAEVGEMRVWWQLQRLPWKHGCADADKTVRAIRDPQERRARAAEVVSACCEPWHKRPCQKRCPKKRASGRPHVCVLADATGLCKPGCRKHAAQCPHRKDGGLVFREIKEKGRKTIPIPPELVMGLRQHRDAQFLQKITVGDEWVDQDLVFCLWNGKPIDPRADWQEWTDILKAAGIPHVGTHAARHAAATLALEYGIALQVVQEMLGHSDIRVTEGYSHVSSALSKDAARRMGKLLRDPDQGVTDGR
jgi:hypothetical protein